MLITLYGSDSYRRIKKLSEIIGEYRKKYTGMSYERIDMSSDGAWDQLKNFSGTRSMFDPVRLVVLDNPLEAENQKEFRVLLKKHEKDEEITIVLNSKNKPSVTYKFLYQKPSTSQEFPILKGPELRAFIDKLAKEYKVSLNADTKEMLINLFGSDIWGIATEIGQLSHSREINVNVRPATDYFKLINSLKHGYNTKDRLIALEIILSERKDDPGRVFNSLAYRSGSKEEANRFADYDVMAKSGKLEYEEILLDLALGS